jgi:hypothetical protein
MKTYYLNMFLKFCHLLLGFVITQRVMQDKKAPLSDTVVS